ncbi:hypothetical protein AGRO_1794 [Agrobacterium sp. ATCC 31749]|nr:hypothetical protein AGRO_1794 [Agrobacterium sp. ATCC 31749]
MAVLFHWSREDRDEMGGALRPLLRLYHKQDWTRVGHLSQKF